MLKSLISPGVLRDHFRALGCDLVSENVAFEAAHLAHVEDSRPGSLSWYRGGGLPDNFKGAVLVAHQNTPIVGDVPLRVYHKDPRMVMRRTIQEFGFHNLPPHIQQGPRVRIHPTAVIGADGQGYDQSDLGSWEPFPHAGGLRIFFDVDIGPCATIMRGSMGDTVIAQDVKIGNGVNIGHDTRIGAHTLIVAGAQLAGWVRVGERVKIWQGAIIKNGVRIGDRAQVGMGAVVLEDVPAGEVWAGNPARRIR